MCNAPTLFLFVEKRGGEKPQLQSISICTVAGSIEDGINVVACEVKRQCPVPFSMDSTLKNRTAAEVHCNDRVQ